MRPIEFRAWNPKTKGMVYTVAVKDSKVLFTPYGGYVPMQFTGLLDRNGVKIWEGDIVKAWFNFGPGGEKQEITVVTIGNFGPNLQRWTFDEGSNHHSDYLPEVIGNIYENPELLEGR